MSNFRAFVADKAPPGGVFYFIESTAPDAVEGDPGGTGPTPPSLHEVDPDQAVKDIAAFLTPEGQPEIDPSLVVMVHGFNTPRKRVLELYEKVRAALVSDGQIFDSAKRRIVCIGYRWPSEGVFTDLGSTIGATPNAALVALALVCVFLVLLAIWTAHWAALLGILTAGTLIMAAALRGIVYFRDVYRATNNGVPDLVEVIRQIDLEAVKGLNRLRAEGESHQRKRIALSFIGHSMGGLVVVSAIRVLSDVFDPDAILTKLSGAPRSRTAGQAADDQVSGTIGHVFDLMRFVLASPDIPGETLLANRANFLASSLRRFKEAYLFSSEGDGVLRSISTIVNYFTFPTRSRNYGYRLGNAEILTGDFAEPVVGDVLKRVRVGRKTLAELSTETVGGNPSEVARAFTYFDCTDYKDGEPQRGMLTEARNYKRNDPNAHIPIYEHIKLLILYVLSRIDIHGGYFDGAVTQRLIYRLACLGFAGTAAAYGNIESLLDECAQHQIRVMPSERLAENALRGPERMDISPRRPGD
jgi:CBS domain-containing protein